MKRKIRWKNSACDALLHDGSQTIFRWLSQQQLNHKTADSNKRKSRSEIWNLLWDGVPVEKFTSEREVKIYIIRFIYSIDSHYAIPSILLYEAGLRYRQSIWVDEWFAPNSGHAYESNIIPFGTTQSTAAWLPKNRRLNFEGQTLRKGKLYRKSDNKLNFIRLERYKKSRKGRLVSVQAPEVVIRPQKDDLETELLHKESAKVPTYDRILQKLIPENRFVEISPNWQDFSWESRPMRPLSSPPRVMPSDADCLTILTAEIGFPHPKKAKSCKS